MSIQTSLDTPQSELSLLKNYIRRYPRLGSIQTNLDTPQSELSELSLLKNYIRRYPRLGSIQTNLDTPQSELSLLKNYITDTPDWGHSDQSFKKYTKVIIFIKK